MNTTMKIFGVLVGAMLLVPANAEPMAVDPVVVETFVVTTYMNGGVGNDEERMMHRVAHEFPLRLTFSERKDDEFVASVSVVIFDAKGNPVFALPNAGPMLYVMLPNGKYKVSARFKGLTESQEVELSGKEGRDLYFHWKGKQKQ